MASKKSIARVVENTSMIDEIDAELEKAQGKWICLKGRRYQARKECLLDFRDAKITGDEVRDANVQNKIIKKIQKEKQRKNRFRHDTNNGGRERKNLLRN